MEFVCTSKHLNASYAAALDVQGREHLVVVSKATWTIPNAGARPRPIAPQPLFATDQYYGDPGTSAMRHGDDFARYKEKCDVFWDSLAHPPTGREVTHLEVEARVGSLYKQLKVLGDRFWKSGALGRSASSPQPFMSMPLHYGHAFGGVQAYAERGNEQRFEANPYNPAGRGWGGPHHRQYLASSLLPNLERHANPVKAPNQDVQPIGLSAIARHWLPRRSYTGTFDAQWRRNIAPFFPEDFDERFNQVAPEDQQIDYPIGGENVEMVNMVKGQPRVAFRLPPLTNMKVHVLRQNYSVEVLEAKPDTLFFETESRRFSVTWRASTPIRRRIHEFATIAVGPIDPEWWHARSLGIDGHGCIGCGGSDT